jgi:hypothetical protein
MVPDSHKTQRLPYHRQRGLPVYDKSATVEPPDMVTASHSSQGMHRSVVKKVGE